jgi:hypothetical protein
MKNVKTQKISNNHLNALGRIFSPIVLDKLAEEGYSSYLSEVCANSMVLRIVDQDLPFAGFLDGIYGLLLKNYRNEYVFKNMIANKILLGKHSLNTSRMLTEFRIGRCKADVLVINDTSTVYEIKTEYDSFARLQNQIDIYLQAFDHVNVVTTTRQAETVMNRLPDKVGVLVLTEKNTLSNRRVSLSNRANIDPSVLFDSLRKYEYTKIVESFFGAVPNVPNTQCYKECKHLYLKIDPEQRHRITMSVLKKRSNAKVLKTFLKESPGSLTAYIINNSNNEHKLHSLANTFHMNTASLLAGS